MVKWTGDPGAFFEANQEIVEDIVRGQSRRWFGERWHTNLDTLISDVWWALLFTDFGHEWLAKTTTVEQLQGLTVVVCRRKVYNILRASVALKRDNRKEISVDQLRSKYNNNRMLEIMCCKLPGPELAAEKNENVTCLQRAIEVLSDEDQEFVSLLYFTQLKHRDIASMMGVTRQAIGQRARAVEKKLKRILLEQGYDPVP